MERQTSAVTISDIAEKLGVSKSTVSRALNCKGRIGAETRRKILEMAESCNYIPNSMAKGLVLRHTFNIGVVVPKDADKGDIPFFQNCLIGISEAAYKLDYDVVLVVQGGGDITPLRRLVTNRKVDGVLLTRLEEDDESVKHLKKEGVPFLVFGTSDDEDIYQIDSDQVSGCFEMTKFMISKGCRRVAVLGGNNVIIWQIRFHDKYPPFAESGRSAVDNIIVAQSTALFNVFLPLSAIFRTVNKLFTGFLCALQNEIYQKDLRHSHRADTLELRELALSDKLVDILLGAAESLTELFGVQHLRVLGKHRVTGGAVVIGFCLVKRLSKSFILLSN